MECGYGAEPARQPVIELAPAAGRGKHWWPTAAVAVLAVAAACGAARTVPGTSRTVVPAVLFALLAVLGAGDPGRTGRTEPGCGSSPASKT